MYDMARIVQARLDPATEKLLVSLRRKTGLSDSELVRKGLELVDQTSRPVKRRKIRGLGAFKSGISDLGSNKQHLSGFGRS